MQISTNLFAIVLGLSIAFMSVFGVHSQLTINERPSAGVKNASLPVQSGMTLVFEDNFEGKNLDLKKWYVGGKPNSGRPDTGEQWSDAHLVTAREPQFQDTYRVENGFLVLRATYDANYRDPDGYSRKWYGAELSSAFPNSRVSGAFRKGYAEARMKLPAGKGVWPGFWMLDVGSIDKSRGDKGAVEIDIMEGYGWPNLVMHTVHDWRTDGSPGVNNPKKIDNLPDTTSNFHTYGCMITDTEIVMFFDGVEKSRQSLPRAKTVSPFFIVLDMAMGGGWKIEVPDNKYYETYVDYVKVWSAD